MQVGIGKNLFLSVNKKAALCGAAFFIIENSIYSVPVPLKSNTSEKRKVFDNGFWFTPEPEGIR